MSAHLNERISSLETKFDMNQDRMLDLIERTNENVEKLDEKVEKVFDKLEGLDSRYSGKWAEKALISLGIALATGAASFMVYIIASKVM